MLLAKQMATQSGCAVDHCSWLTSAPAPYARMGSAGRQPVSVEHAPLRDRGLASRAYEKPSVA